MTLENIKINNRICLMNIYDSRLKGYYFKIT